MDKIRNRSNFKKRFIQAVFILLIIGLVLGGGVAVSKLQPAVPSVDSDTIWTDTVKRGDLTRTLQGYGVLEPLETRWVTPNTDGRVERLLVEAGEWVEPDTILFELSNPQLELDAQDAALGLQSIKSQYAAQSVQLDNQLLDLKTSAARVEADYAEAKLRARSDEMLAEEGLISDLQLQVAKVRAEELEKLKEFEHERVKTQQTFAKTQLEVLAAQIEQAKALLALRQKQVDQLHIKAGAAGILEQRLVEVGQQISAGSNMAKISDPSTLKAVLRIEQNQARDVQTGMLAQIDFRNTVLEGRVARIDPAVQDGSVLVDVHFDGAPPQGARPDQSVSGLIELETIANALHVGRPVFAQPDKEMSVFKVDESGKRARRITVKFGRGSSTRMQLLNGLNPGDRIILSDMSEWSAFDEIRLN